MRFRIDGITVMLRGILGGKQKKKIINTNKNGRVCLFSQNETMISQSWKMHGSRFEACYVIIDCCEDIYSGSYKT